MMLQRYDPKQVEEPAKQDRDINAGWKLLGEGKTAEGNEVKLFISLLD